MLKALKETLGYDVKTVLQYRASRDGWNASDYHSYCDNKGATITLIMTKNNVLCGGFIKIPIQSLALSEIERLLKSTYNTQINEISN